MDIQLEVGAAGDGLLNKLKQVREQLQGVAKEAAEAGKANQLAAQESILAADTWIKKEQELMASIRKQNEEIRNQAKILQEMKAKYDELRAAAIKGMDPEIVSSYNNQIKELKKQIADLRNEIANASKATGNKKTVFFAEGAIAETEDKIKRMTRAYKNMSEEVRNGPIGQELKARLDATKLGLDQVEKQTTKTSAAATILNKSWSFLRQAAYLIPGLGIAGIFGIIADAIADLVKQFSTAIDVTKNFRDINVEAAKSVTDERIKLEGLLHVARSEKTTKEQKLQAIKDINQLMPEYNNSINLENINTEKVNAQIQKYIDNLGKKARAAAFMTQIQNLQNKQIEVENSALEDNIKWYEQLFNVIQSGGNSAALASRNVQTSALNRLTSSQDLAKQIKELTDAFKKELENGTAVIDEEDKKQTAQRVKEAKDRSEQLLALEKQLRDARINAMEEGRQKEIEKENAKYQEIVDSAVNAARQAQLEIDKIQKSDLPKEEKSKAIAELASIIARNNDLIEQENLTHAARLIAIDLKYYEDATKALQESQNAINDLLLDGEQKEIAASKAKYEKLFKDIEDARKKALDAVDTTDASKAVNDRYYNMLAQATEAGERERNDIIRKWRLKALDNEEKDAIIEANLLEKIGLNSKKLETFRQQEVLKIQIEYALKRLELLKDSTKTEDTELKKSLEAMISKWRRELQKLQGSEKIDFYSVFKIDLEDSEKRQLESSLKSILTSAETIWRSYIDGRISDQQRLLDSLQSEIDKQQQIVDKEKELMEKGYANNYSIEQRKLDDLKARNETEANEMKKLQKEQLAFAKAQVIIQGLIAGQQLITAGAKIFSAHAEFPFVGVAMAIAAIGAMFAAFSKLKSDAKGATSFQTFSEGGEFDATGNYPTHQQGGIDVVVKGKKKAEFEKGEYAYFFQDGPYARQFKPFFEAINKRQLSDWRISPSGLELPENTIQNIVVRHESAVQHIHADKHLASMDKTLSSVDKNLKKISADKPSVEYRDGFRIERNGNHVRKIKVKDAG